MKKFLLLILTVVIATGIWYFAFVNSRLFANPEQEEVLSSDIRIGAVNIYGFRYLEESRKSAEVLFNTAAGRDLDILIIQEFFTSDKYTENDFREMFGSRYPFISIRGEFAIASKLPVTDHHIVKFPGSDDYYCSAMVDTGSGKGKFKVLAVHLRTTGMYTFDNGAAVSNSDELKSMIDLMEGNGKIRVSQAIAINEAVEASEEPLIIAGDFNSLPLSKVYNFIKGKKLEDSFMEKGTGNGSTFRPLKGLFRIDFILHDRSFECLDCSIPDDEFSDHRMMTATLRLL